MFIIGIDPHKGSHTVTAVDCTEVAVACLRVEADRHQRSRLLEWATAFEPRTWAVEGATGMGHAAAIIIGRSGDVRRFPTAGHFARHNGSAPIEASSGPHARHRLN